MPSRLNQLVAKELSERFQDVDTCVFVDFTGLSGRKAAELRNQIQSACGAAAAFTVVKTSLARRALANNENMTELLRGPVGECLSGPTGMAYGAADPVALVRTLAEWSKKESLLKFKGGVLSGRPLPADAVAELAKIPPKPVLMGQVVGMIAAPITSLLGLCQGLLRQIAGLADALAKQFDDAHRPEPIEGQQTESEGKEN
ncbi:MAG: 50S ribosomal protein L10 [Planctomycetota bacterium]